MPIRRMKTYTAQTGYVYQYYFVGKREALSGNPHAPAIEYVFDVTPGRSAIFAVSVFLCADALDAWGLAHGRSLTEAEQYAAAKMKLFQGFDELEDLAASNRILVITGNNIEDVLADLGLAD